MIDKNSKIPVYFQLKEKIKDQITNGLYKVGECISSERELSEKYGVSRMTVRQALGELVSDGLIIKEKGKGTFVCEPKVKQQDLMSFTEIISKTGRKLETKVNSISIIKTPEELENVFSNINLYKIDRSRYVDDECIANEIVYVPKDILQTVSEEELKDSFYKILEKKGIYIINVESSIKAVLMNDYHKSIFELKEETPLIQINSKSLIADDRVIFYEESTYRSDKYILEVNISKREGKIR